ncbi:Nuclear transcription factor Y subunit B [Rhynchospora pubera]|uniref:Nuclear transcription factor Y subunit B n=1 Tax=Rhynchospora pubera TaxID=906938 RepID=A0AAV8GFK2_9POAL|nr:Nuclear transcription factor Y subunit B [Rhynchospora pubera]
MEDANYYCALPRVMLTTSVHEDQLLPIANVGRIMKRVLPPNSKISKKAKETMQECASEFIGFVTGEAADRCRKEKRKTINGDDICHAFEALGLDHYAEAMKRYVDRYRECENHIISLKVNTNAQLDSPRAELSLFEGGLLHEDDQTCPNVATTTEFF